MNLISLLMFSIAANLDNIPIGISYALKDNKIRHRDVFIISLFTTIITFFVMIIGNIISNSTYSKYITIFGASALIFMGIYDILKSNNVDTTYSSLPKTILILSLNNLGTGLFASFTKINYLYSSLFIFLFSVLFLYVGFLFATPLKKFKYCNNLSAIIIILLGILQLFLNI